MISVSVSRPNAATEVVQHVMDGSDGGRVIRNSARGFAFGVPPFRR